MESKKLKIQARLLHPIELISTDKDGFFWLDENLNFETAQKIIRFSPSEIVKCKFATSGLPNTLVVKLICKDNFEIREIEFEFHSKNLLKLKIMFDDYGIFDFDETELSFAQSSNLDVRTFEASSTSGRSNTTLEARSELYTKVKNAEMRQPKIVCSICRSQPAGPIRLSSTAGRFIWSTTRKVDTNLCATCSEIAYVELQRINLTQGWWAPRSAILTIVYLLKNIFNIAAHRREINQISLGDDNFPRPKLNIRSDRKSIWIGLISVVFIIFLISAFIGSEQGSSSNYSRIGSCWQMTSGSQMEKVDCTSELADYKVSTIVDDINECPYEWYMEISTNEFGCLSRY